MKVFIGDLFDWQDKDAKQMYITSDSRQFMIAYERLQKDSKTGEEKLVLLPEFYYTNLSQLINKLVTMRIKESSAANLKELLAEIKAIRQHIENTIVI